MRILIFDTALAGHHLEYIHHLYIGASERKDNTYIFAVPSNEWAKLHKKCQWPAAKNVEWYMLNDNECQQCEEGSIISQSYKLSRLIKNTAKNLNVNEIKLINLAPSIPILPLLIPNKIKLSGIIYKIYLHSPKKGIRGIIDKLRYWITIKSKSTIKLFILNDPRSTRTLNELYRTNKFTTLADPVPQLDGSKVINLRNKLGIPKDSKIFLHFGAMNTRKGTLIILDALKKLSPESIKNNYFVFAGRVNPKIKEEFYSMIDNARNKGVKIIVKDEFCSYDELNSLCFTSDCILMPYLVTDLSSGALGYAAVHQTPVIGPEKGLIGSLIKDNNLGMTLDEITTDSLCKTIENFKDYSVDSSYSQRNSIESFVGTFLRSK